tara:strand:- start:318 stop:614 length:297 start_codon:yes stop_codon:yes gene_type:complete
MKKATRATLKSFIKKNRAELLIKVGSTFDGMVDCVMPVEDNDFSPALDTDRCTSNTLGVHGVWLVLGGRDYITRIETDDLVGLRVSNCCGDFSVAINK